jgi:acyl-CoA reductase-like NAD-dependent aldehyde dehydrogenase
MVQTNFSHSLAVADHSYRTINGILARSGQVCVAASRVYVQESISSRFISEYCKRMEAKAKEFGDPQDEKTAYGPLADKLALQRVKSMIEQGAKEAELVTGGIDESGEGCFVRPTVFLNPKPGAKIYTDEVFGPVSVIRTFKTEDEVIEMANDTEFGLMAGVFTRDITRALRVSSRIESGVVGVNCISQVSSPEK